MHEDWENSKAAAKGFEKSARAYVSLNKRGESR